MGRTTDPTVCRRRLARLLRQLREQIGMTAEEAGKQLEWSKGKISRIESGQFKLLRLADVRSALDLYGVTEKTDPAKRRAILELARQARQKGWWEQWSDILKDSYPGFEAEAVRIATWHPLVLPGLFQTTDYAGALIRAAGICDEREIERRVELRLSRQRLLTEPNMPQIASVIGEEALLRPWGTPAARLTQIQRLVDADALDNVAVQIVPVDSGLHGGLGGSFVILNFTEDPSIVYLETGNQGLYLERQEDIQHYTSLFRRLTATALSADDSHAYLQDLARRIG
ncbi:helix-turn-helix domain-containing protein [Actinoallomurus purpureus]|uniref:helix-turn-helix domain-containing protein n=1 Tax=Actinoallomurus purpureus TaxID=478114 RepID=UPI0020932423|nr:helix-turn-helix transcriptional regulator [Actinoallomurus purpureus]MCO6006773.1 helix-turn-helix domain-containing protein [Actinoallomurus purpureus]